jgi:CheY-like chemotaxis protein
MTPIQRKKILIVEDERIVAKDLQLTIEDLGYEVTASVASAAAAISAAELLLPNFIA